MKRKAIVRAAAGGLTLAALALLIPGSPLYLPDLLATDSQYEGRSAHNWAEALESPDPEVRGQAIFALGTIGAPAADAVPALARIMAEDPDDGMRGRASLAIAKMGPAARPAVPALTGALTDPHPLVRMNAARALQQIGPDAIPAAPALIAAVTDESNDVFPDQFVVTVREVMILALGRVTAGTEGGVPALLEALAVAGTDQTRRMAARALGEVGPAARAAIPVLRGLRDSKNPHVRQAVEEAIQKIGADGGAAAAPAAPEPGVLAEDERQYLWEIEHRGNVLARHGFGPLAAALKAGDRAALTRLLADGFTATAPAGPPDTRVAVGFAHVERTQANSRARFGPREFADHLLGYRAGFAAPPAVTGSLMTLRPARRGELTGGWEGTFQLRLAGEHAAGAPAEAVLVVRFEVPEPTEETLARPGWLRTAEVQRAAVARAPGYLFAEVGRARGLDPDRLHDNWRVPPVLPTTGGVYVTDFDRDGLLDVLVTDVARAALYRGRPGGRFEDVTAARGLAAGAGPAAVAVWVDVDGDGWDDLVLGDRVYRNDRGERLVDVTRRTNLRFPPGASGAVVADFDRDGRLDLYVTRTARPGTGSWVDGTSSDAAGNVLLRNAGDWQFQNVTRAAGASGGGRSTFAAAWLDADDDGWPDLYVGNEFGDGLLLVNRRDGTFTGRPLADRPADFGTMGLAVGDVDNDGRVDIYSANMYSKAGTRVISNLRPDAYPPELMEKMRRFVAGSQLHRNKGEFGFDQAGAKMQVGAVGWAYGACLADLDADGFLDIYATAGYISRDRSRPDG